MRKPHAWPSGGGTRLLGLAGLLSLAAACQPSTKGDGGTGFQPATHTPLPIVPNGGGPVFSAAQVVTVTFDDDANQSALETFTSWLVQSSWYQTVGQEYGVGPGAAVAARLPSPAPDPLMVDEYLRLEIEGGNLPAPGPQTIYLVYFSATTSNCTEVVGYHSNIAETPTQQIVFGVASFCPTASLTGLQEEELEASHELVETATNPLYNPNSPTSKPAYLIVDPANPFSAWGGAVAELCIFPTCPVPPVIDPDAGYYTARIWSNAAASADDQEPCIPSWTQTYFNVSSSPAAPQVVAAGASTTFTLTGWSAEQRPAPWTIQVVPSGQGFTPTLSFSQNTIQNGQTLPLTVTVPAGTPSGTQTVVYVYSGDDSVPYVGYWPLVITVQ